MGDYSNGSGGKVTPVDEPPRDTTDIHMKDGGEKAANGVVLENGSAKKDEKKKEEPPPMVGTFQLFRFADGWDIVLMITGVICACAHGCALPAVMIVFGDMTDAFVNSAINTTLAANASAAGLNPEDFVSSGLTTALLDEMRKLAIYYVIIACGVLIMAYGQIALWQITSTRQGLRLRVALFRAILRQEIGWFDVHEIGELNTRLNDDVDKVIEGTGDKIGNFFQWFTSFVAGLVIGFVYGWKLTLVILAFTPLLAAGGGVFTLLASMFTTKELNAYAKAGAVAEEAFGAIRTVVAFGGENKELNRYSGNLGEAEKFGIKKSLISGVMMGVVFFIIFCVYGVAFWYGSKLIREDPNYGVGTMLIVFFAVVIGAFSLGNAGPNLANVGTARGAAYTIYQIIDSVPLIDSSSDAGEQPSSISGNIEFRNVHFRYPSRDEVKVLDGLDLQINVGQTVALVGASGCGKSTTVQLIQRFYDPLEGAILIDKTNIKDLNVTWLRKHIGLVSQEPILFATTIAENIRYGKDGVTQAQIEEACKAANAHDFVSRLPQKYETLVGERGAQLSGGQKQRIAIARAIISDPKILLLDEATSALDTESEASVQAALDKARAGRTTLVIAHRLSTIKNADVIYSVENGKVAESGTHDELMAQAGIYNTLVTNQTKGYDEEDMGMGSYGSLKRTPSHRAGESKARLTSQLSVKDKAAIKEEEEKLPTPGLLQVLKMNAPETGYIVLGCICAIINGAIQPGFALIFAEILGVYAKPIDEQVKEVLMFSLLFVALGVLACVGLIGQYYFFAKSGEALTMRIRLRSFKAIIGQDISYFDDHKNSVGALTSRLSTDASAIQGATGARLGVMFQSLASIGMGLIIGLVYSWKLTLLILAFVPFIMVGGILQMKVLQGSTTDSKAALEDASKIATEAVENMRTVASLTREDTFIQKYKADLDGPFSRIMRNAHPNGFAFSFTQALLFFAYAACFTFGAWLVENDGLEYEDLFRVFFGIVFSAMAAGQASAFAPDYGKGQVAAARLFALFDSKPSIDTFAEKGETPSSANGTIGFHDVKFSYASRQEVPVLQGLSLSVEPGQTVALVGASGCGKSTSIQLIERFYDTEAGHITIDGKEYTSLNVRWLRAQLGLVSQEPILFDASIKDNIAYGDNSREVAMDEIIKAAREANIHSFIDALPQGYETPCGDKGTQLSGGQKQRIAIARALVRNPKVLLLDEATSALDTESEKVVQEALDRAREGRTCVVIAHRLSTIQNADCILVIHQGKVVEQGTHKELLSQKGFYYRLHDAQLRKI